jgi:hypothetical protein
LQAGDEFARVVLAGFVNNPKPQGHLEKVFPEIMRSLLFEGV